jgi:hypothetical protein
VNLDEIVREIVERHGSRMVFQFARETIAQAAGVVKSPCLLRIFTSYSNRFSDLPFPGVEQVVETRR